MPVDLRDLLPSDHYDLTSEDRERFAEEAALGMVVPSNPLLNAIARPVDPNNLSAVATVIEDMKFAAIGQRQSRGKKKRRTLVGLAAPQIGVALRIILVDTHVGPTRKNYGRVRCFINPEILWRSRETAEDREGCFSAGPVWGLVRRPIAVKVRALNLDGTPFEQVFEGFTARILQHEIDHLEGIRFPDRIRSDRKRHWVHTEELGIYVKHIRHWKRQCSLARWQSVKEGKAT
jgi:peptide deformylase